MDAKLYEMVENFRSAAMVVAFANAFVQTIPDRMKSKPLRPAPGADEGTVRLVMHAALNFEAAVVEDWERERPTGTSCIMTWTNDEALHVFSLLVQKGVKARLVQSNDGFKLGDLAEIRYFRQCAFSDKEASVISAKKWDEARSLLCATYADSACLADCLALLDDFAASTKSKYKSDFDEFLWESKMEDFGCSEKGTVVVSTIHKSKGREYDSVYILLNRLGQLSEEKRRAIYVGITRAKKNLRIHYSDKGLFENIDAEGVVKEYDDGTPNRLENVIVQLSHKDVVLDFFLDKKPLVCQLRSGTALEVDGNYLVASLNGYHARVAKFSQGFVHKLSELVLKGYQPRFAKVRYVVAWKKEGETHETAIVLPDLYLSCVGQGH